MQTEISSHIYVLSPAVMLVNCHTLDPITDVFVHVADGDEFPSVVLMSDDKEAPMLFPSMESVLKLLGALETEQNAPKKIPNYLRVIELSTDSAIRDLQYKHLELCRYKQQIKDTNDAIDVVKRQIDLEETEMLAKRGNREELDKALYNSVPAILRLD